MKVIAVFTLVAVSAVFAHNPHSYSVKVQHHEPVHHEAPFHGADHHAAPLHAAHHAVEHHAAPHHTVEHAAPHHEISHGHEDYFAYPKYKYEYGVHDPHTKDHKSQWEHRDGDVVKGEYTLDEADGTKRIVKYSSDKKTGFEAQVERVGHATHPEHYHKEAHHEAPVHHKW